MIRARRVGVALGVLVLTAATCGSGATNDAGTAIDETRAVELCDLLDRIFRVRWAIYEDRVTMPPEEVEELMAESDALHVEIDRLMPDEARPAYEVIRTELVDPIDELTAELGWSPSAALNSGRAAEIFENRDLLAAVEDHHAFQKEYCVVEENLDTPTAPVTFDDMTIVTYNSTPVLNDALTWGLERFARAGLDVPPIASATFTMQNERCEEIRGRYLRTEGGIELEFCVDERAACRTPKCTEIVPGWNAVILHEIAHAWLDTHLDTNHTERFLDHVDLETWRDSDLPWDHNGQEHAADTIAWGLMDRDIMMFRIGRPTTNELTEGFVTLTDTDPLPKSK